MVLLSDYQLANFARPRGSKDKKPRLSKLRKAIWNANTANAAAVGATLGLTAGAIRSGSLRANRIGALTGLGVGTGLGIRQSYKRQK